MRIRRISSAGSVPSHKVQYLGLPRAAGWHKWTFNMDPEKGLSILVDDKKVAFVNREPGAATNRELKVTLPLAETAGKSQVTITFRAHPGARTGRLLEVRSVQEHLE
jgi:hypothetical protein